MNAQRVKVLNRIAQLQEGVFDEFILAKALVVVVVELGEEVAILAIGVDNDVWEISLLDNVMEGDGIQEVSGSEVALEIGYQRHSK